MRPINAHGASARGYPAQSFGGPGVRRGWQDQAGTPPQDKREQRHNTTGSPTFFYILFFTHGLVTLSSDFRVETVLDST